MTSWTAATCWWASSPRSSTSRVKYNDPAGELVVSTGGMHIVQGQHHEVIALQADKSNEGYSDLVWRDTQAAIPIRGGKIASLLQLRDGDARQEIQSLDLMAVNFTDLVNEVHRQGFGLNGEKGDDFFVERPFIDERLGQLRFEGHRRVRLHVAVPRHRHQPAAGQGPDRACRHHHPAGQDWRRHRGLQPH